MSRTLITSALPYANGYIHLGHLAGAYLPADIYARYMRLAGKEVLYVCGSDEHGVAITISADKEGVPPKQIIDKYHKANLEAFAKFGMSFDFYSRTSNKLHHEDSVFFFEKMLSNGFLTEKEEEQFYDEKAKMFLPDRYVEGTCPVCGEEGARGDQCDKCGAYYEQTELKNPISVVSNTVPTIKKTTHWYFKLGQFQEFIETYIESNAGEWKENVLQQCRSWLKMGLADRAITRDLDWGVSIENAKGVDKEKAKGKVLYVWFDAVLGYITATKEWAMVQEKKGLGVKADDWKKWWKDESTQHIAFIGKDNIVFHAIMLPALEMAFGGLIMPHNIPANEFLNLEGQKFSKSRNWSIDLRDFIDDFNTTQAVDALRYTLATSLPENKDADFTWKDFQAKNNNELAAILGNYVNRVLTFVHKNMGGRVPILPDSYSKLQSITKDFALFSLMYKDRTEEELHTYYTSEFESKLSLNDFNILLAFSVGARKISRMYRHFRIKEAVAETMNLARAANKYFNDEEPWKTIKSDPDKCHKTMFMCTQIVYSLSIFFSPIIPYTSAKIQKFFNISGLILGMSNGGVPTKNFIREAVNFLVPEGSEIAEPTILFSPYEDDVIQQQIAKLGINATPTHNAQHIESNDGLISIDDFSKMKLQVGKVLEAEAVPKSKKLIKMQVKVGDERRQVLAGVAEHYKPEELIGKSIVVVANLRPATLMGLESQGMMLCASDSAHNLFFLTPEKDIADGSVVK
ncbi:MAG: methionine--tRNA ligase [Ignavibacteria bacterium]|jgi:methionyl-tRNA synthetase|nr:methionine--tRNA ligase [Ignavibacteria bacterium]